MNHNIFYSLDIYKKHFMYINGIDFSYREIDIISSLLNLDMHHIPSFLSIDPRGLESHSRNIRKKAGNISNKKSLISFIQKSKQFSLLKNGYYHNLQIRIFFENQLNLLIKKLLEKKLFHFQIYLFIDEEQETNKDTLKTFLKEYLNFSNWLYKIYGRKWKGDIRKEKLKQLKSVLNKFKLIDKNIDSYDFSSKEDKKYIIYIVNNPNTNIKELYEKYNKFQEKTTFIFIGNKIKLNNINENKNIELLELTYDKNYYQILFEILKLLFPDSGIEEMFLTFNTYSIKTLSSSQDFGKTTTYSNIHSTQKYIKKKKILYTLNYLFEKYIKIDNKLRKLTIFLLFLSIPFFLKTKVLELFNLHSSHTIQKTKNLKKGHLFKPILWNIPRQDYTFVGREKILRDIYDKLNNTLSTVPIYQNYPEKSDVIYPLVINAISGLGGVGKTQIALEYIHHSKYPYTLRAWFPGENIDQLYQTYIEFSKKLGYRDNNPKSKIAISYVKNWLENNPGWVLVYDNVKNYEEIVPFLPSKGGHIILTTRKQQWPDKFKMIPVNIMTEKEALILIKTLTKRNIYINEKIETKKLVKALGYLPLALAQAGAYIQQNKIKISEYLKLYNKYEKELLADTTLSEGTNSNSISTTWNISFKAIAKESKNKCELLLIKEILSVFSYLSPEKIPRQMLLTWLIIKHPNIDSPELILNKILRLFWKYSIINYDGDNFISIHRLVQTVIRNQHKSQKKNSGKPFLTSEWYTTLLQAINFAFNKKATTLEEEKIKRELLPHLQSLIIYYNNKSWVNQKSILSLSSILENVALVLHKQMGNPQEAKTYYQRALTIKKKYYGYNSIETANILTTFGDAYGSLGNPNKQKEFLEHALKVTEQYYGKSHSSLVRILESLGAAYWALGNEKKSKIILKRGLKLGENYYGNKSIKIAKTLYYLGNVCGNLGEIEAQKKFLENSLKITDKHYGKGHIQSSFILGCLGIAHNSLKNLEKSRELLESSLLIQEKYYGKNHVEVGETLGNLSNTYMDLGYPKRAEMILKRAVLILENYYGKDHAYVARTLNYLGDAYIYLGEFEKAINILKRTLTIKQKYYGENHFSTAKALASLGNAYVNIGKFEKAKKSLEIALKIQKNYYGKHHSEVAKTVLNLKKSIQGLDIKVKNPTVKNIIES